MMGLGYLGSSSSSSSSSNLSPLAPPFTVDRSNHNKPVLNSNSISHFNDPSYGVPFTSSWPYSHPSTARQEFSGESPRTSTLPSNDCGYMIPEAVNLPTAGSWSGLNSNSKHGLEQKTPARSHWSAVYPSPKRVTDSFSYNISEAKPFYPPYASSVNNDDAPLVTFSEPSYDLLSTSGLVHGDKTSQVDYTRSLSGLEYNPQQDSVWSGLPEGKQVKKMESDDSFFSEEANMAASLAYNKYLNQGGYGTETSSKSKEDPSLFYYADIIRRANNSGPSSNGKSEGRLDPTNDLGSTFRAFPMFSEAHPLIQSSEDLWNSQNSYNPYEKRYHMFDCSEDHIKTKSSTLVIKPPAARSMSIGNLSALKMKEKEKSVELGFQIGTSDERTTKEDTQVKFEFKARPSFEVAEISIPNVNVNVNTNSFEQIDHHNPAEDSPCWKGAPASHFLPFEAEPPTKKLQTGVHEIDKKTSLDAVDESNGEGNDTLKLKSPNPEMMYGDASVVVKSLYDLSDLLLLNEFALKEHDREALDHVIRNLGVCMSRPKENTSNMSQEVTKLQETPQKAKSGENLEKLLEHSSLRVEAEADPPNMVQAIKKVLDENLECKVELPSETLLYKNLWLEAEAELCSLSFRGRFERLKRESHKSKSKSESTDDDDATNAIKEISSCNASSDPKIPIPPKPIHKDDGIGIDDVETGVMARFNILKHRQHPNPASNVEVGREASEITKDDIDPWVMDRLNILKRRGELSAIDVQVRDCGKQGRHFQDEEDEEEEAVGSGGSDWEHILKDEFSWRLS